MKLKVTLAVLSFAVANFAFAETTTPAATAQAAPAVTAQAAPTAQVAPVVTVTTVAAPTANIAAAPTAEIVKQPTTVVEATPLTNSHADELRKSREQTEVETEQKIVEKLEQSRINDEKKRQDHVLGAMSDQPAPPPVEKVEVAPAPVVAAAPATIVVAQPAPPQPVAANTTTESVKDFKDEVKKDEKHFFMSAGVGAVNYNDSPDVKNFGAFDLSFGEVTSSNFALSADLGYNNLNLAAATFYGNLYRSVDQYTLGATGRFMLLTGKIRPSIGGTVDYVRRQYSDYRGDEGSVTNYGLGKMASDAIDGGVVAAIDVAATDTVSLAFEYRYMMNLTYQYENQAALNQSYSSAGSLLENRNYQSMIFALRYTY